MLQPEGDSLSDDLLFGSGPANWNGSAQSPSTPNPVTDTRVFINQLHDLHTDGDRDDNNDRPMQNTTPRPNSQGAEGGARPKVNNSDRLGSQTLVVRNETRNKSTKDKENKHKNSKKKENSVQNGWFHNVSSNNTTDPNWSPALQLVQYNQAVKKNGNGVKHKKQTMNENSALANNSVNSLGSVSLHGNSNIPSRHCVIQNTPVDQLCANDEENESEEFLNLPSGIDPNSDPSCISRIYVRPGHVIPPNPLPGLKSDPRSSVSENIESKSPSVNSIHNNLWENSKNCNVKEIPNIQNGLRLNAFRNDIDIETDSLPLARADLPGIHRQSSNPSLSADQIVNHFPGSNISANINRHANSPTFQQTGDSQITVPYYVPSDIPGDELSINLESLQSDLPTDLFFGDGNYENDYLYAQQLQMQFDKQNSDYRTQMQYDDFTNMDYLNLSGDQRRSIASKQVNNARRENNCDRVMNDVYDPELLDDGLSDSLFMTSQNQEADDDVRTISPDVRYGLPAYPDPSLSPSNSHCLRGQSFEDEQLARQIAEEIRIKEDEDLARQLQMQDDLEQRAYPVPHPVSRRPDINEYRENSEPLHARYNRAWQTWQRPLTVPTSRHGNNVMDSTIRGVSSTERPLARRVPLDLVELEYLENIHSPTNEYRLLPGGRGQYEFNPEYMLDDYGEESLVSINRDPRMLATLLMERSPNMMIPNEIDLNDYEALWELAEGLGEVKRVGMEHNEILALPVHIYKGPMGSDDNKTDCLVCLSEFKKGEELRTLPCCHIYHVTCIDEWLKRNAICPVCRQSASQRG